MNLQSLIVVVLRPMALNFFLQVYGNRERGEMIRALPFFKRRMALSLLKSILCLLAVHAAGGQIWQQTEAPLTNWTALECSADGMTE